MLYTTFVCFRCQDVAQELDAQVRVAQGFSVVWFETMSHRIQHLQEGGSDEGWLNGVLGIRSWFFLFVCCTIYIYLHMYIDVWMFLNLLFGTGWLGYICIFFCRYLNHGLNVYLWQEVMCLSLFAWVEHLLNQRVGWEYLLQSWPRLPLCDLWSQDAVFALINVSLELRFVEKQRRRWNPYIQKHIPAPAAIHVYNTSPSHVRVKSSSWIDFKVFSPEMLSNALKTTMSLSTLVLLHKYSWLWCQHHELTCFFDLFL